MLGLFASSSYLFHCHSTYIILNAFAQCRPLFLLFSIKPVTNDTTDTYAWFVAPWQVNIFFFVDSPYKRKAARRISRWLELRFLLEILAMPLMVCWAVYAANAWDDLEMQVMRHRIIIGSMLVGLLVYFSLWTFMQFQVIRQIDLIDIFTASERGDQSRVEEAIAQLVKEVKDMTKSASAEIDLNKPDVDGNTLLMLASQQGHAQVPWVLFC